MEQWISHRTIVPFVVQLLGSSPLQTIQSLKNHVCDWVIEEDCLISQNGWPQLRGWQYDKVQHYIPVRNTRPCSSVYDWSAHDTVLLIVLYCMPFGTRLVHCSLFPLCYPISSSHEILLFQHISLRLRYKIQTYINLLAVLFNLSFPSCSFHFVSYCLHENPLFFFLSGVFCGEGIPDEPPYN